MTFDLFPFHFEELPLSSYIDGNGIEWRLALVDGQCDVECDEEGNWSIRAIQLDAFAPSIGGCPTCLAHLDPAEPLFELTRKAIEKYYTDRIDDDVCEALAENGIHLPDPNKEHRLTKSQLV